MHMLVLLKKGLKWTKNTVESGAWTSDLRCVSVWLGAMAATEVPVRQPSTTTLLLCNFFGAHCGICLSRIGSKPSEKWHLIQCYEVYFTPRKRPDLPVEQNELFFLLNSLANFTQEHMQLSWSASAKPIGRREETNPLLQPPTIKIFWRHLFSALFAV